MRELYLNGQLADISDKTNIDLVYRSFLFSDISKIDGNRSWTIQLPKTINNCNIIEQAQQADYAGDMPYAPITVDYYEDNYHLINGGNAVLTNITDTINIVITFGKLLDNIKQMDTVKLRELDEATDKLDWNRNISYNDMSLGFGWCDWFNYTCNDRTFDLATETNPDIPAMVTHPCVTYKYLIEKIATHFSIDLSELSNIELLETAAFPLREYKGVSILGDYSTFLTLKSSTTPYTINHQLYFDTCTFEGFENVLIGGAYQTHFKNYLKTLNQVEIDLTVRTDDSDPCELRVLNNVTGVRTIATSTVTAESGHYLHTIVSSFEFNEYDDYFYFYVPKVSASQIDGTLSFQIKNRTTTYNRDIVGGIFPIVPNLPDATCAKILLDAMQLTGVFPFISESDPTIIHFSSVKNIYDNIATAKDWSDKLVKKMYLMSESSDLSYKFGDYAQKNWLKYKKDDKNTLDCSGYLDVQNTNLEKEKDIATMQFTAGRRNSDSIAVVDYPLYDISVPVSTAFKTPTDQNDYVIGRIVNIDSVNYLMFPDDMKFSSIVQSEAYTYYNQIIRKPKFIKESFYLNSEDVYKFDFRTPIYLSQFGKYYAVMQITYNKNAFSQVELLELK